ncbi:12160_t:CDS:2, partial [Ambispora leptoticha]
MNGESVAPSCVPSCNLQSGLVDKSCLDLGGLGFELVALTVSPALGVLDFFRRTLRTRAPNHRFYVPSSVTKKSGSQFTNTKHILQYLSDIDDCMNTFQLRTWIYDYAIEWIPFDRLPN